MVTLIVVETNSNITRSRYLCAESLLFMLSSDVTAQQIVFGKYKICTVLM